MRILAPFDQTYASQSAIPMLARLARIFGPELEVLLLSAWSPPPGTPGIASRWSRREELRAASHTGALPVPLPVLGPAEAVPQASAGERALATLHAYLLEIARRLPPGTRVRTEARISAQPRVAIIDAAEQWMPDLIVMATHTRPRASGRVLGSTTEAVVESGVAPTLVVHPDDAPGGGGSELELMVRRRARLTVRRGWRL